MTTQHVWMFLLACLAVLDNSTDGQYPPEFNTFMELIPGVYNKAQADNDTARGLPVKLRHQHWTTSLKQEYIPFLSERRNFYLEQYRNGNTSDVFRQTVLSFGIDPYTLAMQLKSYELSDPSKFVHAKTNDSVFSSLRKDDVIYDAGCDVYWYQAEGTAGLAVRFESWMMKACNVSYEGEEVIMTMSNNLTFTYLTSWQRWTAHNGSVIFSQPSPYNMTRSSVGLTIT